ncbi:MAG: PilN domain-containing protein [Methylohalobius sp. ZOD2]
MAIRIDQLSLPPAWRQFWHWWQDQLIKSIPEACKRWFFHHTHILLALPSEGEVRFWRREENAVTELEQNAGPDSWRAWQAEEDATFTLLLLPGQYLHKQIYLPLAAQENLHQVIGFELDRQTPFSADQVYFSSRVIERLAGKRQLKVEIVLTPREFLDDQLAYFHQAGLKPRHVDAAVWENHYPVPLKFDLLPPRWRTTESHWRHLANWTLGGILMLLIGLALALPIVTQNKILEALEDQVDQTRRTAQITNKLKKQVTELEQKARFVLTRKRAIPPIVEIMNDLSQRLPLDTWLNGFNYREGELRINGHSPAASKLIEILEASPFLSDIHFVSPITQDRRTGLERFQISMNVGYEHDDKPD